MIGKSSDLEGYFVFPTRAGGHSFDLLQTPYGYEASVEDIHAAAACCRIQLSQGIWTGMDKTIHGSSGLNKLAQ